MYNGKCPQRAWEAMLRVIPRATKQAGHVLSPCSSKLSPPIGGKFFRAYQAAKGRRVRCFAPTGQKAFFNAETGNALTTVRAGLALTMTTFPKTSLFPAFVAGFKRVLIMQRPGTTNFPALLVCCVPISAKLFTTFVHSDFFISVLSESACAKAPLLIGLAPAFIAFMGAMLD